MIFIYVLLCLNVLGIQSKSPNVVQTTTLASKQSGCIETNEKVILKCTFQEDVDCTWDQNGVPVYIDGESITFESSNGRITKNCSIIIQKFDPKIHTGNWSCASMVTESNNRALSGAHIWLSEELDQNTNQQTRMISAKFGAPITLNCIFQDQVSKCNWEQNNGAPMRKDFRYIDGKNGKNTYDCSIEFENFRKDDIGKWKCFSKAQDERENTASINVAVTEKPSDPAIKWKIPMSESSATDITCYTTDGNPPPKLQWSITEKTNEYSFTSNNFEHSSQRLQCIAEHPEFPGGKVAPGHFKLHTEKMKK